MPTAIRVLILEDRPADAELMVEELRRGGFDPVWRRVDTETDYLACLVPAPSVILADYHLPQFDAARALHLLQERGLDIPFIVVSGAIGEDVAVAAMRHGAADYLLKDRMARLAPAVSRALEEKRLGDEKRRAEEALRGAERNYREIFENAVEGICQTTPEGRFVTVNPALARMLGYSSPEEVIAAIRNIAEQLYVHPERRAEFLRLVEESGSARGFECQLFRKDRTTIWVSVNTRAVRDDSGKVARCNSTMEDITEIRAAEAALRQYQQELQCLTARLISAQEAESKRLGRELHDAFGQRLAVLGIELDLLRRTPPDSPALLQERLARLGEQVSELAVCFHETSRTLHPATLDDLGLCAALKVECAVFSEQHGIPVKFSARTLPERLPEDISLCLYRVVQESLWNIRKHARARQVRVALRGGDGAIGLAVEDDGCGFAREAVRGRGGLGLVSMEERVRLVNGSVSIAPRPGGGTRVEVRVPHPGGECAG